MEYHVNYIAEGKCVTVPAGTTLLEAQRRAGLPADAPCGGRGTCKKCAVEYRGAGEAAWQRELACRVTVDRDMEARLLRGGEKLQVLTGSATAEGQAWDPMVQCRPIHVAPCARGDSTADWSRLCAALGGGPWQVNMKLCRDLGALLKRAGGDVWAVTAGDRVLDVRAEEPRVCVAAFDLGTTSIAAYLIEVSGERRQIVAGMRNPQAQYGGDVISRADYALEHGPQALADCAREAIDGLLGRMCEQAGIARESVYAVLLAGNTAMHHLFLGISPDSLVHAPYNPVISEPLDLSAAHCGLRGHPAARLYLLPVIGGFVGADTVGCLIAGDWLDRVKLTLMIDIGTNGELVLGDKRRRIACSTAAGPAFEGAKITCGMRGAEGAVDHVWLEDGILRWHVLGDVKPVGICGSGLVDLVAMLLQSGAMDDSGRLEDGDRYDLGDTGVYITQKDIREVQLAKAAMAAGIVLMAEKLGVEIEDIEEVDIAGAFGNYIDPDNACAIGLIPGALRQRIVPVGNAAGEGARRALINRAAWRAGETLARHTEFLELATMPRFQDEFVDQLAFPEI